MIFYFLFNLNYSIAGTGIHRYRYYDTRMRPVNMRILKIHVPVTYGYPFTIFISYPLRVLSADTRRYEFFWHPSTGWHCSNNM